VSIDIRSILVASALINVAFLGLSAFTWLRGREEVRGSGYWFLGFSCFTVGIALVALRGAVSDFASIFLGNAVILAGIALKVIGILRYLALRRPRLVAALWIVAAGASAAFFVFQYAHPSLPARMLTLSAACVFFGSVAAWLLLGAAPTHLASHARMAAVFYLLFSAVFAFRVFTALNWRGGESWIASGDASETWAMALVMVIMAGIAVSEMLLIHGKLESSLRESAAELGRRNDLLAAEIARRVRAENELIAINRELGSTQQEIMITLSEVVEFRSKETALHVARVGAYARTLCEAVGLSGDEAKLIGDAAPMHDIGKISVPDDVLNKPTGLTAPERELIRAHTTVGYRLLNKSERPLIKMAARIALEHHEQWDGLGYPEGKKGDGISFAGRVVCLCDVYDALSVARPYKEPWELPRILEYIRTQRAQMFDPALVDAFFLSLDRFLAISERLAEPRA
jgi:HD-GYP domain-containing protein (c-di-GMP phosphodiesterase class II)